jgi:CRISPR-associated exonuclease Cas4
VENAYTLEGTHSHQRVHETEEELCDRGRVVRGLWLRSERLRLVGKADVVEFRGDVPYPVEHKRGRRRRWDNDSVQLCAQGLCLEEMLGVAVPAGAIYHLKSRRRREIIFSASLRAKTEEAARRLHELVASGVTPAPVVKPRCRGCSLRELCMPELLSQAASVRKYHERLFTLMPDVE